MRFTPSLLAVLKLSLESQQLGERRVRVRLLLAALRLALAPIVGTLVGTGTATILSTAGVARRTVLRTAALPLGLAPILA
jgi:hypothetical protein